MRKLTVFVTKQDSGGAFLAIDRLFSSLLSHGYLVQFITINDIRRERLYFVKKFFEKCYRHLFVRKGQHISLSLAGVDDDYLDGVIENSDVLILSWVNDGLLNYKNLMTIMSSEKPVFWRLSDMWAFTGGCHYAGSCTSYSEQCEHCPKERGLLRALNIVKLFQIKKKLAYSCRTLPINILSPSAWMANTAGESFCFEGNKILTNIIGTCCDEKVFFKHPHINKQLGDSIIPPNKVILTFGAKNFCSDDRKGLREFLEAIQLLPEIIQKKVFIIFFGEDAVIPNIPVDSINAGQIDHHEIAKIFNISDAFIMCSAEENFANTIIEALMCGCPVIASNRGGSKEVIVNEKNGYIFSLDGGHNLASKISKLVDDSEFCREKISDETALTYATSVKANELANILNHACKWD